MFSDPQKNINQLGISEGMKIADFGAGSGFYAVAAAKKAGSEGRVYAIDIQRDLLMRLEQAANAEGLSNIEYIHGDLEEAGGTKLRDNFADVVIVSNILFQIEKKEVFVKEALRVLKPTGRVLVVDWKDSFGGMGPEAGSIVSESAAKELFTNAGFEFVKSIDAGAHHYGFVTRKSK